jgi:sulfatase maturation enzyme AslB (radical SAM superfamily)
VQLITNAAGPSEVIERLSEIPNFQVCVTLDGHTAEMNRFRTKGDARLHGRVIETVNRLVAASKRVELNCVITEANASQFREYLLAARQMWGSSATIIPFPVRMTLGRENQGENGCGDATPEQVTDLEEVIVQQHSEFADQLPPLAYTQRLIEFMRKSQRSDRCHIHRANFGVNTKFQALACACAGDRLIQPLGTIAAVGFDPEVERRRERYLRDGNVGAKCGTCFTHYDVVNLYFEGSISDDEIARIPSLSAPESLVYLREIRNEMLPYLNSAFT